MKLLPFVIYCFIALSFSSTAISEIEPSNRIENPPTQIFKAYYNNDSAWSSEHKQACSELRLSEKDLTNIIIQSEQVSGPEWHSEHIYPPCEFRGKISYGGKFLHFTYAPTGYLLLGEKKFLCRECSVFPEWVMFDTHDEELSIQQKSLSNQEVLGDYQCTISESAGIASSHMQSSGPPKAYSETDLNWKFYIRIRQLNDEILKYEMTEIPYTGKNRDPRDWHTVNSVLHSPYIGDGIEFSSTQDQGFVSFHKTVHKNDDGDMSFYHAGFAWAGGEDSYLLARWARCKQRE